MLTTQIILRLKCEKLLDLLCVHMAELLPIIKKLVAYDYSAFEKDDLNYVDELRTSLFRLIRLDSFREHWSSLIVDVGGFIVASSTSQPLNVAAFDFLTEVSMFDPHVLVKDNLLPWICEELVLPTLLLTENDKEIFRYQYAEFISRDMQWNENRHQFLEKVRREGVAVDFAMRRVMAFEFLEGIALQFKEELSSLLKRYCFELISDNLDVSWKLIECAIFLIDSGNFVTDMVDYENFLNSFIAHGLRVGNDEDVNLLILKAVSFKHVALYGTKIPREVGIGLLPGMVQSLDSHSMVIHAYAARCIWRLFRVMDKGVTDIKQLGLDAIKKMFAAMKNEDYKMHAFVSQCIVWLLSRIEGYDDVRYCRDCLRTVLERKAYPKSLEEGKVLLKCMIILLKKASQFDVRVEEVISSYLQIFKEFQCQTNKTKLVDCAKLISWGIRVIAHIVESRCDASVVTSVVCVESPSIYATDLGLLLILSYGSWSIPERIESLILLLRAVLRHLTEKVTDSERFVRVLKRLLQLCLHLVGVKFSREIGFYVLNTLIDCLDRKCLAEFLEFKPCIRLLHHLWSKRDILDFMVFASFVIVKHGIEWFLSSWGDEVHLFGQFVKSVWIQNLPFILDFSETECKLVLFSSIKLLSNPPLQAPVYLSTEHWGVLLDAILTVIFDRRLEEAQLDELSDEVTPILKEDGMRNAARMMESQALDDFSTLDFDQTMGYAWSTYILHSSEVSKAPLDDEISEEGVGKELAETLKKLVSHFSDSCRQTIRGLLREDILELFEDFLVDYDIMFL